MIVMCFLYTFIISALEWEVFCVLSLNVQVVWWDSGGEANDINEDFAVKRRVYWFTASVISALQEMCVLE
jgi:hypothetical protein